MTSRGQSIANLENSRQVTSLRLNLNILTAQKMVENGGASKVITRYKFW